MKRWLLNTPGLILCVTLLLPVPTGGQAAYPVVRLDGKLHLDAAFYDEDRNPLSSGAEARRARLAATGEFSPRLRFQLEVDFADDELNVRDAWLMYDLSRVLRFQAGSFKEPFTLENVTNSNYISFLERSLMDGAFAPPRHLGAAVRAHYSRYAGALGVFGNEVGAEFGPVLTQNQPIGVSFRNTVALINSPGRLLHLGAGLRWRSADVEDDDSLFVAFAAISETHVDQIELYNTGNILNGTSYNQAGGEAAIVRGPFSVQGEYVWTRANRSPGVEPVFSGGYVFLSVIPTGESRAYDAQDARFLNVTAARHWYGAIELLLRYSRLDLNDAGILGGAGHDWTLAGNWYPTSNVRVMVNYVFTNHDAFANGDGSFAGNDDFSVFQFRVAYFFK